jgi:phosphatidylglycerol:prolipoprotein diacylglycerol transferase
MKEILFPAIGLKININSIAISICGIDIYWYAILIVSAFVIAILLCKKDDGKYNIKFEDILELLIILIPISIVCARLYFVLFKLDYYVKNPLELFNIRNGGLAIYGGIIGAVLTILIYCKIKKLNAINIMDYIVPYLPLGQAIGRWGNFLNVEAHGIETNSIFRMGIVENGVYMEVHPTFLYESLSCFLIFIILYLLRNNRKYTGQITLLYIALSGFIRTFIEGLRTDSLMIGYCRISQILSIILCVISSCILIYKKINKRNLKNE